jgi:hypothetical protein
MGTLDDSTPWLAMKLIRGQMLAKLLASRERERPDLPRYVHIFEQIAQAVGFAHSRGVIHQDSKPLNVMVGEFGEVQVMDWDLVKELGRIESASFRRESGESDDLRHTAAGTVMGTPGYMAPEQARGEVVDARADVFALGSILAAILTGKPAFVGTTARETITKAANADLADVRERLNSCGADAELLAVAFRCLAAKPEERYADSRDVAAAVAAYRASIEARLRQAETEKTAALVRKAEGRGRRRQLLLAASVVLLTLTGDLVASLWQMQGAIAAEQAEAERAEGGRSAKLDAQEKEKLAIAAAEKERLATELTATRLRQIETINNTVFDIFSEFDIRQVILLFSALCRARVEKNRDLQLG